MGLKLTLTISTSDTFHIMIKLDRSCTKICKPSIGTRIFRVKFEKAICWTRVGSISPLGLTCLQIPSKDPFLLELEGLIQSSNPSCLDDSTSRTASNDRWVHLHVSHDVLFKSASCQMRCLLLDMGSKWFSASTMKR